MKQWIPMEMVLVIIQIEPDNPDVRTPQDISVEISDTSSYILAGAIIFLALVILFVRRKAPPQVIDSSAYVSQDSMWND